MHLGFTEILLILVVILVLFGAGKFPKIMENFANGINVFKKTIKEDKKKKTNSLTKKTTKKKRK